MRNLTSAAVIALLACTVSGCKKSEPAIEATTEAVASDSTVAALAPHAPGDYVVSASDGKPRGVTTLN
ncbi:MAG: hypothetical protein ABIW31_02265, partial [Novosphingobium sp.]